jgi:hypothetical protein
MRSLSTQQIDILNIALMFVALSVAFFIPFELFLFSYAVLGPLHYLTEISWLHKKQYFVPGTKRDYLGFAAISVFIGALVLISSYGREITEALFGTPIDLGMSGWGTNLIFLIFGASFVLVLLRKKNQRMVGFAVLAVIALFYNLDRVKTTIVSYDGNELGSVLIEKNHKYLALTNARLIMNDGVDIANGTIVLKKENDGNLAPYPGSIGESARVSVPKSAALIDLNGETLSLVSGESFRFGSKYGGGTLFFSFFLPTLIHVFLFTALFMLFGALKSNSGIGLFSVLCLFACAALPFLWDPGFIVYEISSKVKESYEVSFFSLNLEILKLFEAGPVHGRELAESTVYTSSLGISLTRFIAFAYTYHYLNWFSKTSIIQWHKVPGLNLAIVGILWVASVGLYAYNYKTGLHALFFLSFLHVFMEFPLNVQSIKGIISSVGERFIPNSGAART